MKKSHIAWSGALAGAIALVGCSITVTLPQQVDEDFTLSTSFDGVETFRVRWVAGDIRITLDDTATEIEITGTKSVEAANADLANEALDDFDIVVEATEEGPLRKTLRFEEPTIDGFYVAGADVEIVLPAGVDLDIRNDAGDVTVVGVTGFVEVQLDAGTVSITQQVGDTLVEVGTGSATIASQDGNVDVQVDAGAVTVAASPLEDGMIMARTDAGSLEILVPETFGAALDLRGSIGSVEVDLDAFDVANLNVGNARVQATLNGGGGTIEGTTGVGSVEFGPR